MKFALFIIFLIIIIVVGYVYFTYQYPDMTYIKSDIDNNYYLVRNTKDKRIAANLLAKIMQKIIKISDELEKNKDNYPEFKEYIELLHSKSRNIILIESAQNSAHTSYSVNKGEQIIFCLRTKYMDQELHDINLIMYVVLHEISHVACPIYDNHGPLFKKIFNFLANEAVKMGIYNKIDFKNNPTDYCGMTISESII